MKLLSLFVFTICMVLGQGSLLGGLGDHHHHNHDHEHDHNNDHNHSHHDHMSNMTMAHMHAQMGINMTAHAHEKGQHKPPQMVSSEKTTSTTEEPARKKPSRRPKKFRRGRKFSRQNNGLSNLAFNFRIPRTGFSCKGRAPGYYADMEAECTVYHMCNARGGGRGFLCPMGTKFHQKTMVCDFAKRVKCEQSSNFFHRNVIIHEASLAATKPRKQLRKLPRLTNSDIITIKTRPETIRAKSNGRMGFAPLFEEERRKKIKMLRNVVKIMKNKAQTTTTTTSSTTTTSTTTTTATTIKRIKDLNPNHGEAGRKSARRPFTRTTTARTTTTRTTTTRTKNARTTTITTTTTTTTTTSTTTHKITTIRPIIKSPEELLGLPEIPEQLVITPSPIFQIRVESPKSFKTSALENNGEDLSNSNSAAELFIGGNNQRWQIIPPVEASKAIAKHRVDPEQPILSLEPPPLVKKRPVSPFQIVGHVMSDEELKSFPDSPIVNISLSTDAKIETHQRLTSNKARPKSLRPFGARLKSLGKPMQHFQSIKRTGKSEQSSISLPIQLGTPGGNLPGPLVWISPASLARSPMVNLRTLSKNGHHARPPNVERALTMVFPARQNRRFEESCLVCLSSGGLCPHCLVVKR